MQNTDTVSTPVQPVRVNPTPVESQSTEPEIQPTQPPTQTQSDSSPNLANQLNPTPVEPQSTPEPEIQPETQTKLSFSQKIKLIRKKYEYINGKKMEPVAAEEQARRDLSLPVMTDSERAKAGQKNIFEKILTLVGLNKKLSQKSEPADQNSSEQNF